MKNKFAAICLGGLSLMVSGFACVNAQEMDQRGYMLASSCAACHGPDGQSPGAIPSLYGKDKDYIVTALKEFKSGEKSATVMNRLAKGYSDDEIDAIAAWFAARK